MADTAVAIGAESAAGRRIGGLVFLAALVGGTGYVATSLVGALATTTGSSNLQYGLLGLALLLMGAGA